ncbi:hypothetical protein [Streptomyces sp. JJ36]|uniref:hypothetical protein n=1 Tax=Streptomyces sp. JJ36 TaxID=2736645 RepID=UPI001F392395|nr:hypothetical protein [Streptomyces sp. JJ36]MCF6523048.1 hypothetical protein [Streptomyces sp. JJ36]
MSPAPSGDGPRRTRRRGALLAGAAVLAVALLAGGAFLLTRPDGGPSGAAGDPGADAADGTRDTADPRTGGPPEDDASPGTSPSPAATPPGSPAASGPGSPTASAPRPPGSAPSLPDPAPGEIWVAQLASVPKSDGVAARSRQHAELSRSITGVRWVDSDDFAALRPGYWMFYRPGPDTGDSSGFADGHAAADWCAARGLTSADRCVGRFLSDDRTDRVYLCAPGAGTGTGRCTRPD